MISTKNSTPNTVKFLCSYGGKILPRPSDGNLRYVGGHTRVVSVLRSVSLSDLMAKLSEMCGHSVVLRCQLPNEEMDVLVTVKSDEDLACIIEEYDRASLLAGKELKIKAVLSPPKPPQPKSNSSSSSSSLSYTDFSPRKPSDGDYRNNYYSSAMNLCPRSPPSPIRLLSDSSTGSSNVRFPYKFDRDPSRFQPCHLQANNRPLILHLNYRQ